MTANTLGPKTRHFLRTFYQDCMSLDMWEENHTDITWKLEIERHQLAMNSNIKTLMK